MYIWSCNAHICIFGRVSGGEDEDADGARDSEASAAGGTLPQGAEGMEGPPPTTQTGTRPAILYSSCYKSRLLLTGFF